MEPPLPAAPLLLVVAVLSVPPQATSAVVSEIKPRCFRTNFVLFIKLPPPLPESRWRWGPSSLFPRFLWKRVSFRTTFPTTRGEKWGREVTNLRLFDFTTKRVLAPEF